MTEPTALYRCDCGCGTDIYAGDFAIETLDGDIVYEDCWAGYCEKLYVRSRFLAGD